ncbi:MAG TPA: cellulase family glycosylhydrolase, partial [Polyangiaceae bacterium]|nr:cellulase family glycosylhydrolase [Polyangiaceae bacterium]
NLLARHSGMALDIAGVSTAEGARASQWNWLNGNNQKFTATLTTAAPTPPTSTPPTSAPPASTPVAQLGQLKVVGTRMKAANGSDVQLEGVSSMWLNWENDGYAESATALKYMRDNWGLQVIRAAMGVTPSGAYLTNPDKAKAQVNRIVQNAIDAGVYVIIDWHDHDAHEHPEAAIAFFQEMARKWGGTPNVIWETFNEPLNVSWTGTLKPYHQRVVSAIRAIDPDNIIVLGTGQWSQKVKEAAASPLAGTNLMYTLHFYSCTHTQWLRDEAQSALNSGLPIFVTEWGATHADGGLDGRVCLDEADRWQSFMRTNGISWAAWKLDGCSDSSCLLKAGAPQNGPWTDSWLHGHGAYVRSRILD